MLSVYVCVLFDSVIGLIQLLQSRILGRSSEYVKSLGRSSEYVTFDRCDYNYDKYLEFVAYCHLENKIAIIIIFIMLIILIIIVNI